MVLMNLFVGARGGDRDADVENGHWTQRGRTGRVGQIKRVALTCMHYHM